jgi:transcriptional regulator with XRE-family HTH domain
MNPFERRLLRILRKNSQEKLGKKMGRSQTFISRLECGKRKLSAKEERAFIRALGLGKKKTETETK